MLSNATLTYILREASDFFRYMSIIQALAGTSASGCLYDEKFRRARAVNALPWGTLHTKTYLFCPFVKTTSFPPQTSFRPQTQHRREHVGISSLGTSASDQNAFLNVYCNIVILSPYFVFVIQSFVSFEKKVLINRKQ